MANIALLHHTFIAGSGIDGVLYELGKRLAERGHMVRVITQRSDGSYLDINTSVMSVIPVIAKSKVSAVVLPLETPMLRFVLSQYDVVHTQLYPSSVIPIFPWKLHVKHVATSWGVQDVGNSVTERLYTKLLRRAENYVVRKADIVLAGCESTRRELRKIRPDVKTLYQYGIDFDFLCEQNARPGDLAEKYPVINGKRVLLFIGRNSPHKRIDLLIKMMNLVQDKKVMLVIVGRQDFRQHQMYLEELVRRYGLKDRVLFTGVAPRSEIPSWYARCEMFVNASVWEGFLIPEAFALRKPIVAYAVDAHEEVLGNDRGLLVKDATPLGFALAVKSLLDNPSRTERLGENGYRWARENLDYDKITDNWEKIVFGGQECQD